MAWKNTLKYRQELILATSWKDKPHAIPVLSLGFIDQKLLIGACIMKTTLKNLQNNNKVSIATKNKKEYYRIEGRAKIFSSGKYLKKAINLSRPPLPHHAILINITQVVDLVKGKKVF